MADRDTPQITFADRGEGLVYYRHRRTLHVDYFSDGGARRLYPDRDLHRWPNGEPLSESEKRRVFGEIVRFLRGRLLARLFGGPLTVVVNSSDPDHALWERLTFEAGLRVERTSDAADFVADRQMYLEHLSAGRVLRINDAVIRTEADLDAFLAWRHRIHGELLRQQRDGPVG